MKRESLVILSGTGKVHVLFTGSNPEIENGLYHCAWFVGLFVSGGLNLLLTRARAMRELEIAGRNA